ncbi:sodium:solute symporter [Iodidimonas gelatinilytica]|nr:sodium:solute symporter [Iodidimonas gelatinilytica]
MNGLDYSIIAIYLAGLLFLGYAFRQQSNRGDYFLGGRSLGWFPLALSTMATQLSAISFISAPAFVGIRDGGGMIWLSYELAVPLAMIFLMWAIMPRLYASGHVSIYEFLEDRFDYVTRFLISIVFQISRAFGTGISIYAIALILESMMGLPFWGAVLMIGVITALYSLQGGMKAVVYADAIQMGIIFLGIFLCAAFALYYLGGLSAVSEQLDPARFKAVSFTRFGISGDEFGFLPMLFGGMVLYASYYGCDQTQAQRILSAKDARTMRQTLLANGLLRFPMVVLYCVMGLLIGALVMLSPDLSVSEVSATPDTMIPQFILTYLPHGLIGLLVVAILSSAMSSLSSVINSLSAVTTEDIALLRGNSLSERHYVLLSRLSAMIWALVILGFSFFGGAIADTVIEAINKVGSMFYGPILATFLLAIMVRDISARGANWGLMVGVGTNLYLWLFVPQIFWFWWNVIGLLTTFSIAFAYSIIIDKRRPAFTGFVRGSHDGPAIMAPWRETIILLIAFGVILTVIIGFDGLWTALTSSPEISAAEVL